MNFQTLLKVFVAALYNETALTNRREFRISEIVERYNIPWKTIWEQNFIEEMERENFAKFSRHIGPVIEQRIAISGGGVNWVEQNLGENVSAFLEKNGLVYEYADSVIDPADLIDSESWTGLPSSFVLTEQKLERLVILLREAEASLDAIGASNQDKAMARAFITAAKILADAPDPPADLIWEIVNRANQLSGIASLFVSIIALFASVGS